MNNYLILSAFPAEQTHYIDTIEIIETKKIAFIDVTVGKLNNKQLYFATTGMGTSNAACVVATLCAMIKFEMVIFSGTCGGIDKRLNIGDVIIAESVFDADIFSIHDAVIGTPFEGALINPNIKEKTPEFFPTSTITDTHDISYQSFHVFTGKLATSNHFPSPAALFQTIQRYAILGIDMESSAIAQFSWLSKVPCMIIRGVSNLLNHKGNDKDVHNADISSSNNAAKTTINLVKKLP